MAEIQRIQEILRRDEQLGKVSAACRPYQDKLGVTDEVGSIVFV